MRAKELMSSPVITIHVNESLSVAAQRMWDADVGALAVVNDEGKLTGMITDRDVCMAAWTQGRPLEDLLVNSAMAHHLISARLDDTIGQIYELMATNQIRRIPITDASGFPAGVISLNDLAIESAQPDTRIKHAAEKLTQTLAAICKPRARDRAA